MNLVMDERLKHRLVGLAVIISIAAIFAPAIIKKSNHRFDGKSIVSVKLPPKPKPPQIVMPEKSRLFKSVKVAHVIIPSVSESSRAPSTIAKAGFLDHQNTAPRAGDVAKREAGLPHNRARPMANPVPETRLVAVKGLTPIVPSVKAKSALAPKYVYSVQVATFSKEATAVALVNKLKEKGFKAYFNKATGKKATIYKVMTGKATGKQDAQKLQKQLASSMRLKGLIVSSTGIS